MPLVSIIIINWNGKSHLSKCLSSLQQQQYQPIEIILVDNASTDGSIELVKNAFPQVKIIINPTNLGFAEANNIGYAASHGELVLFLNNDTQVTHAFLKELVAIFENDATIGGAQSKLLLMDKPTQLDSVGAFLTPTGFLYHYGIYKNDSPQYNQPIEIYSAKGACMIFRRSVLEQIQNHGEIFDHRYFAYAEETDLCHRVWLAGYKIIFVPGSIVYHKMGGTSEGMQNTFITFHSFKNRINSYLKNLSPGPLVKILIVHLCLIEAYALMQLVWKRNLAMFTTIQKSIFWNLAQIQPTWIRRQEVQHRIRKISDKMFFTRILKHVPWRYYYYLFTGLDKYQDPHL